MTVNTIVATLLSLTLFPTSFSKNCALYDLPVPGIHCFHGNQVNNAVTNSQTIWMLEFYSSWCGHCQHFAPVMKEIGAEVAPWSSVFKLGVLECTSSDENQEICSKYKVVGYPTLRFFKAHSQDPVQNSQALSGARSKEFILKKIITEIEKASIVPALEPLSDSDVVDLPASDWIPLVLIFEEEDSYLGKKLVMDYLGYPQLFVRRVLQTNRVLVKHYSILELPSLVIELSKGDHHVTAGHSLGDKSPELVFKSVINQYVNSMKKTAKEKHRPPTPSRHPPNHGNTHPPPFNPMRINRVHRSDILGAVSYALRHEVPIHAIVSGSAYSALLRFLILLEKAFAGPLPNASECLQKVRKQVDGRNAGSFITRRDWIRIIGTRLDDKLFPVKPHWSNCVGSQPHLRGYPCGLWMLMHTLTILTLPHPHTTHVLKSSGFTSKDVLRTLSSFVRNFLSCEVCRDHFSQISRNLSPQLHHDGDAILWLWEAHNVVSNRLREAVSTDPYYPKTLFPEMKMCPYCYHSIGAEVLIDHTQPSFSDTGFYHGENMLNKTSPDNSIRYVWNRTAVLLYLWNFYHLDPRKGETHSPPPVVKPADILKAAWPKKIANTAKLHHKYLRMGREQHATSHLGFNGIDKGICVMSYVMCFAFLGLVGYWLFIRKRRKKFF